jgi:hypothetical protein
MVRELQLRDVVVARLKEEFGEPSEVGQRFHWSVPADPGGAHAVVNIAVDSWTTPAERVRVWVFDPSKYGYAGVQDFKIEDMQQVEAAMEGIHHIVDPHHSAL